jgi:thiamine-phosphate pyrophosphorylase
MARCYSERVSKRHPSLPRLWLISDARNDAALETVLARLPRGSGLVFRHYHLPKAERRARFRKLAKLARLRGHAVVLSGTARQARQWGADGAYGSPAQLAAGPATLRLATVHSLRELRRAGRADAVLLSPLFVTRSHPGGSALGPVRALLMARSSAKPVLALGGMTPARARRLPLYGWAAIDGLSP